MIDRDPNLAGRARADDRTKRAHTTTVNAATSKLSYDNFNEKLIHKK